MTNKNRLEELELTLHKEVPLSKAMGVKLISYDGTKLEVGADFESNINIHGTAFAGSLFSLCALTAWSFLNLKLGEEKIEADVTLKRGEIEYNKPVVDKMSAICSEPSAEEYARFLKLLTKKRKAGISLSVEVSGDDEPPVTFIGKFAAATRRASDA